MSGLMIVIIDLKKLMFQYQKNDGLEPKKITHFAGPELHVSPPVGSATNQSKQNFEGALCTMVNHHGDCLECLGITDKSIGFSAKVAFFVSKVCLIGDSSGRRPIFNGYVTRKEDQNLCLP